MYKCINSDQYYTYNDQSFLQFRGEACSNDPHFYQYCDKRAGGQITNSKVLCEHYICNESGLSLLTSAEGDRGACSYDCENTDLNKEGCDHDSDMKLVTLPSGLKARPSEICNEICEVSKCEDEALCNGYQYGVYCENWEGISYMSPNEVCDGYSNCYKREDENCTVTKAGASCRRSRTGEIVPVHNNTRCTPIKKSDYSSDRNTQIYCIIENVASYQTNCSDPTKVALTCKINGYQSTISKFLICFDDRIAACDDRIDGNCFKIDACKIHKHLMCDKNADCKDGADENYEICSATTIETCKRRVGGRREVPIPISWLRDGVWDCIDGIDEIADWETCGQGKTL